MADSVSVDRAAQREATEKVMQRLEENLDPDTLVGDLRIGQQQLVEIARALLQNARVLIMDEPTSALSMTEVDVLFRVIRELKSHGVAVVYISHHLEEALEIADDVAVLRDGRLVATATAADVDLGWVVKHMVGRDQDSLFPKRHAEPGRCRSVGPWPEVADPIQPTTSGGRRDRPRCACRARSSASTASWLRDAPSCSKRSLVDCPSTSGRITFAGDGAGSGVCRASASDAAWPSCPRTVNEMASSRRCRSGRICH